MYICLWDALYCSSFTIFHVFVLLKKQKNPKQHRYDSKLEK